jgi:hypothetical protein
MKVIKPIICKRIEIVIICALYSFKRCDTTSSLVSNSHFTYYSFIHLQGSFGYAKNITFQNVEIYNVRNPIIINQYYCNKKEPSCSEQVIFLTKMFGVMTCAFINLCA